MVHVAHPPPRCRPPQLVRAKSPLDTGLISHSYFSAAHPLGMEWRCMTSSTNAAGGVVKGAATPWLSGLRAILFLAFEWGKQSWHMPVRR
jgi:hypothetical protein